MIFAYSSPRPAGKFSEGESILYGSTAISAEAEMAWDKEISRESAVICNSFPVIPMFV
jgi:hypothetical protein